MICARYGQKTNLFSLPQAIILTGFEFTIKGYRTEYIGYQS